MIVKCARFVLVRRLPIVFDQTDVYSAQRCCVINAELHSFWWPINRMQVMHCKLFRDVRGPVFHDPGTAQVARFSRLC